METKFNDQSEIDALALSKPASVNVAKQGYGRPPKNADESPPWQSEPDHSSPMPAPARASTYQKKPASPPATKLNVHDLLAKNKDAIAKALPSHLTADRMIRLIASEVSKNPKLAECTALSLIGSIMQCSQLGLEPGGSLGQAYFIPRKNNEKGVYECQFMLGYRGMISLARRSGQVLSISAREVYSQDVFKYSFGFDEKCKHIPSAGDRGQFVGVYAIVQLRDGARQFDFLSAHEIEKIRLKSADYSYWIKNGMKGKPPIWHEHFDEMAKKSAVRRIFKYLPISIELQEAIGYEESADRGEENAHMFEGEFDVVTNDAPVSKSEALANAMGA